MCPNCETKFSLKKSFLILGLIAIGLFGVKGYASGTQGGHDHSKMNHAKMDNKNSNRKSLNKAATKSVISALEANEALHNAFFNYDATTWKI